MTCLCESRMRENCTSGLSGGRGSALRRPLRPDTEEAGEQSRPDGGGGSRGGKGIDQGKRHSNLTRAGDSVPGRRGIGWWGVRKRRAVNRAAADRHYPKVRAVTRQSSRTDPCGGPPVRAVPTATAAAVPGLRPSLGEPPPRWGSHSLPPARNRNRHHQLSQRQRLFSPDYSRLRDSDTVPSDTSPTAQAQGKFPPRPLACALGLVWGAYIW